MSELYGLILTGGQSERMGREKAEIRYGDKPQWQHLEELLAPFCRRVYWSCNERQKIAWNLGDRALVDKSTDQGPSEGLRQAFASHPGKSWLVVACDYPALHANDITWLTSNRNPSCDATSFRNPEDHGPEPLLAIWEPPAQHRLLSSVESSPRRCLKSGSLHLLDPLDPISLLNVNTPDDLAYLNLSNRFDSPITRSQSNVAK